MENMNRVKVTVRGAEYSLMSADPADYVKSLASVLDKQLEDLSLSAPSMSQVSLLVLCGINALDAAHTAQQDAAALRAQDQEYLASAERAQSQLREAQLAAELARQELETVREETKAARVEAAACQEQLRALEQLLEDARQEADRLTKENETLMDQVTRFGSLNQSVSAQTCGGAIPAEVPDTPEDDTLEHCRCSAMVKRLGDCEARAAAAEERCRVLLKELNAEQQRNVVLEVTVSDLDSREQALLEQREALKVEEQAHLQAGLELAAREKAVAEAEAAAQEAVAKAEAAAQEAIAKAEAAAQATVAEAETKANEAIAKAEAAAASSQPIEDMEKQLKAARAETDAIRAQSEVVRATQIQLKVKLAALESEAEEREQREQSLTAREELLNVRENGLAAQAASLRDKTVELDQREKTLTDREQPCEASEKRCQEMEAESSRLREQLKEALMSVADIRTKLEQETVRADKAEAIVEQQKEEIDWLCDEVDKANAQALEASRKAGDAQA